MDEINIWTRDHHGRVAPVQRIAQVDYEHNLEETLIAHPEMLAPGLTLIARQLRTGGGPLDLLGIDAGGRLILFELKRGRLARDVVTQAIDYASWLDSVDFSDLARDISEHSPKGEIEHIDDFESWYDERFTDERFTDDQRANLRPTKVVLVGLGLDSATERIARWLNTAGVDISAITFHGFEHSGQTLLARQVEVSADEPGRPARTRRRATADPRALAEQFGLQSLWDAALQLLDACFDGLPVHLMQRQGGLNYDLRQIDGPSGNAYAGIGIDRTRQGTLFIAIHDITGKLAPESFAQLQQQMTEHGWIRARGNIRTKFYLDSLEQLNEARDDLTAFFDAALSVWRERRTNTESETQ